MDKCLICNGIGYIGRNIECPYCCGAGKIPYCKCEICGKSDKKAGQMFYAHDNCIEKASGNPILSLEERRIIKE